MFESLIKVFKIQNKSILTMGIVLNQKIDPESGVNLT